MIILLKSASTFGMAIVPNALSSLGTAPKEGAASGPSTRVGDGRKGQGNPGKLATLALAAITLYSLGAGQSALAAVAVDCAQVIADYADVVPTPSAVDPAQDPVTLWGAEQAVLCLVNQERDAAGISALAWSDELEGVARVHSVDWVVNKLDPTPGACPPDPNPGWFWYGCSHRGSDGSWPEDRIPASGYCAAGCTAMNENTYYGYGGAGYASPRAAVNWWMSDPPHRATILNADYMDAGPGVAFGTWDGMANGATYTLDFGARM